MKKYRKRLARKVLAGKLTVDEARSKLGRRVARNQQKRLYADRLATVRTPEELGKVLQLHPRVQKSQKPVKARDDKARVLAALEKARRDAMTPGERDLCKALRIGRDPEPLIADPHGPVAQSVNPFAPQFAGSTVYKTADPALVPPMLQRDLYSPDPAVRETAWQLIQNPPVAEPDTPKPPQRDPDLYRDVAPGMHFDVPQQGLSPAFWMGR